MRRYPSQVFFGSVGHRASNSRRSPRGVAILGSARLENSVEQAHPGPPLSASSRKRYSRRAAFIHDHGQQTNIGAMSFRLGSTHAARRPSINSFRASASSSVLSPVPRRASRRRRSPPLALAALRHWRIAPCGPRRASYRSARARRRLTLAQGRRLYRPIDKPARHEFPQALNPHAAGAGGARR